MSQLVRLEGEHTTQNAHCAMVLKYFASFLIHNWRINNNYIKLMKTTRAKFGNNDKVKLC